MPECPCCGSVTKYVGSAHINTRVCLAARQGEELSLSEFRERYPGRAYGACVNDVETLASRAINVIDQIAGTPAAAQLVLQQIDAEIKRHQEQIDSLTRRRALMVNLTCLPAEPAVTVGRAVPAIPANPGQQSERVTRPQPSLSTPDAPDDDLLTEDIYEPRLLTLLRDRAMPAASLRKAIGVPIELLRQSLRSMQRKGLIREVNDHWMIVG